MRNEPDTHLIGPIARALIVAALALVAAVASLRGPSPASADTAVVLPPIRHVFIVNLENTSYRESLGNLTADPYLAAVLRGQGLLIQNYYGIGHNSLDNYIAQVSGQAPNPQTQDDCPDYTDFPPRTQIDSNGQAVGQACVYPPAVQTIADQLEAKGLTWKGYMEEMGNRPKRDKGVVCPHPPISAEPPPDPTSDNNNPDKYLMKHNPFVYFHSVIDEDGSCRQRVVPMTQLFKDIQRVDTTPNLSYITPTICNDGHDQFCRNGYAFDGGHDGGLGLANRWSSWLLPQILASPAYRQDGMLVLTFDESDQVAGATSSPEDDESCCNEVPGPNSPMPGISGPGGGKIGAVIVSPYVKPGTVTATAASVTPTTAAPDAYNHYSLLRSLEDLFGITTGGTDGHGHLGFAATPATAPGGPGAFGNDVYNRIPGSGGVPGALTAAAPSDPTPGAQPTGPRAAGDGVAWDAPAPQGNDLNGIACQADGSCLAVGDVGSALFRSAGGTWAPSRTGTVRDLLAAACTAPGSCVAVGAGGIALVTQDGGQTWSTGQTDTSSALRGVACPSSSVCYAVGDNGTIERSDDGGSSWSDLGSGVSDPLARISCPSVAKCFAAGGETRSIDLLTTDGGGTWTPHTDSTQDNGTGVSCADLTHCAITTPNSTIRWTTDWGSTWGSSQWTETGTDGARNHFRAISCPTTTICFLASNRGGLFKDQAAGSSHTTTKVAPAAAGDDLNDISCPSATQCWAVGDEGQIRSTADGGTTWASERSGLVPKVPGDGVDSAISALRAASCTDSGACVAVGDDESIATQSAPGAGWVSRSAPAPAAPLTRGVVDLFGVSCGDAGACVAVGSSDTILKSGDGGASWSASPSPAGAPIGNQLYGVSCFGTADCVAVGAYGRVITSGDGGSTWAERAAVTPYSLNGVSCSANGTCVAVGSLGTIVRSTDAGATWSVVDSGTLAYLSGASCPTDVQCVAVGQNGMALTSLDGGLTWSRSDTGVDDQLASVHCSLPTSCVATGSSGTVLRSGDLGSTWTAVGTGTARDLNGVGCAGTVVCYAVGESATVLAVADQLPVNPAFLSVGDVAVNEGDSGLSYAPLTVSLSAPVPTGGEVRVSYATEPLTGAGAATPELDYESVSGRLRFMPGESQKIVQVPVIGDLVHEGDERLSVVLSSPDGALIGRGSATVTILDDDPAPSGGNQQPPATLEPPAPGPALPAAGGGGASSPTGGGATSGGGGVLGETKSSPCHIPRLAARRLVSALRLLARTSCAIGRVRERRSRSRVGTVIAQSPRAGTTVPAGTRVSLTVSRGRKRAHR